MTTYQPFSRPMFGKAHAYVSNPSITLTEIFWLFPASMPLFRLFVARSDADHSQA